MCGRRCCVHFRRLALARLYDIFDVRNEDSLSYNSDGIAKLIESDDAAVWFARLLPGKEIGVHTHSDCEDNSLVVTGKLTYLTGMAEPEVSRGGFSVARPDEVHGYRNVADWPLHLLLFTPSTTDGEGAQGSEIRQRVFRPAGSASGLTQIYKTRSSQGFQVALSPGATQKIDYARAMVIFILEGRIMTLVAGDKVSLDPGEGVFIRKSVVEVVGVAGHSTIAVFATRP